MQISVYKDPYIQSYQKSKSLGNDSGVINSVNQLSNNSVSNKAVSNNTTNRIANDTQRLKIEKNNKSIEAKQNNAIENDLKFDFAKIQNNPNLLLSDNERDYFKSLFPESAEQIEKHKVFNRNAKVQTQSINKGLIFDTRI